jgi:histidine triad (HIT) family protein
MARPPSRPCPFCAIARDPAGAHLVLEDEAFIAFLDRRPLFHGHTLVVPRAHHETLMDLPEALLGPLMRRVQRVAAALEAGLDAKGVFVGQNNRVSQSVPHLHVHVVPRRPKDGLKGFFWPRTKYAGEAEMAAVAGRLREALGGGRGDASG